MSEFVRSLSGLPPDFIVCSERSIRELTLEGCAEIFGCRSGEARKEIDHHEIHVVGMDSVENPLRAALRVIEKIKHRARGVTKAGKKINMWSVRSGIDVAAASVLLHNLDQIRIFLGVFAVQLQSARPGQNEIRSLAPRHSQLAPVELQPG